MKKSLTNHMVVIVAFMLILSFMAIAYAGSYSSSINIKSYVTTSQNIVPSSSGRISVYVDADVHVSKDSDALSSLPQTLTIRLYDEYTGRYVDSKTYGPDTSFNVSDYFYGLSTAHTYEVRFENNTGTAYIHGPVGLSW